MRLTQQTDYSVRVLMYLAVSRTRLSTISEISDSYGISRNHLTKVVHQLARMGYVTTVRGRSGGMRLARPAEDIDIGDVVRAVESPSILVECFPGGKGQCVISPECRLKLLLAEAQDAFFAFIEGTTLADITDNADPLRHLLSISGQTTKQTTEQDAAP